MTSGPQALLLARLLASCALKNRMGEQICGEHKSSKTLSNLEGEMGNKQWSKVDRQLSAPVRVRKKRQAKWFFWKVNGSEENS